MVQNVKDQVPGFEELQKQAGVSDMSFMRSLERAREQGFDTTTVWYMGWKHKGGRAVRKFWKGSPSIFVTTNPRFADKFTGNPMGTYEDWVKAGRPPAAARAQGAAYGHIYPLYVRVKKTFDMRSFEDMEDFREAIMYMSEEEIMEEFTPYYEDQHSENMMSSYSHSVFAKLDTVMNETDLKSLTWQDFELLAPMLEGLGYDSYADYELVGGPQTGMGIFDPNNAKSIFARFDPENVPEGRAYEDHISHMRSMDGRVRMAGDGQARTPEERKHQRDLTLIADRTRRAKALRGDGRGESAQFKHKEGAGAYRGVRVLRTHTPTKSYLSVLNDAGVAPVTLHEMERSPRAASAFTDAIKKSKTASRFGAAVYVYPKSEYEAMRLFISPDGNYGFAIKSDGDLVSAFSDGGGKAFPMLALGVEQGAHKLDAFDTVLPYLYRVAGFREVGRDQWNEDYRPDGWNKQQFREFNGGEPDVVYMEYDATYNPYPTTSFMRSMRRVDEPVDGPLERQSIAPHERTPRRLGSAGIDKIVADNKSEEARPPAYGIPRFSSRADPESQYVARNPQAAPEWDDLDVSFMRAPDLDPELQEIVDETTAAPPEGRHYMHPYNAATADLKPTELKYWITKAKQAFVFSHARYESLYHKVPELRDLPGNSSVPWASPPAP
jgi:hypothetical protein